MKKSFKSLMAVATAMTAFASCQLEVNPEFAETNKVDLVVVSMETKTSIDAENKIYWSNTDKDQLILFEDNTEYRSDDQTEFTDGNRIAQFHFSLEPSAGSHDYTALYPYSARLESYSSDKNPLTKYKITFPSTQSPTISSFDPNADCLVAKKQTLDAQPTSLSVQFKRLVAFGAMTITGLDTDEAINSIKISTTESKQYFAGRCYLNLNTSEFVMQGTGEDEYVYTNGSQELLLNYTDPNMKNGGTAYFTTLPVSLTNNITVVVETDSWLYTRTIDLSSRLSPLAFNVDRVARFTVNMATANKVSNKKLEGDYIIIGTRTANSSNWALSSTTENSATRLDAISFTYDGETSLAVSNANLVWHVQKLANGNYYIYYLDGETKKYVSWSSGNTAALSEDTYELAISAQDNEGRRSVTSASTTDRNFVLNNSTGSDYFAFYTSNQAGPLRFVPNKEALKAPTNVAATADGNSISVIWDDIVAPDGITVTYQVTCTGESNQIIDAEVETAEFTGLADGTYTVTVTAKSSDTESYLDSEPVSVEGIIVGTPTLDTPTNVAVSQVSLTKISASWDAVENATSYEWTLYTDAEHTDFVGNATTATNSLDATINNEDWTIEQLVVGSTYYFTVVAKAAGYNDSAESVNASFTAAPPAKGTAGNPYSASELYDIVAEYDSGNGPDGTVYVQGYVVKASAPSSNAQTYYISDDGTETNAFEVYKGKGISGADLTDANRVYNGDFVIVGGSAVNYKGNTPEFNSGSEIYTHTPKLTITISPEAGTYNSAQSVTITSTPSDATIYYTTDGSTPTTSSSVYSSAISVSTTTTIKALAVKSGCLDSDVASAIFTISDQKTYSCTFTSKAWANTTGDGISWTSGKDGGQLLSGQGVQVSTTYTGANATTTSSFTNISRVVVTYSTNTSRGAGNIEIQIGENTKHTLTVTNTGGTSDRTTSVDISPNETGKVKLTVNCKTNSIYVKSVDIIAD